MNCLSIKKWGEAPQSGWVFSSHCAQNFVPANTIVITQDSSSVTIPE